MGRGVGAATGRRDGNIASDHLLRLGRLLLTYRSVREPRRYRWSDGILVVASLRRESPVSPRSVLTGHPTGPAVSRGLG